MQPPDLRTAVNRHSWAWLLDLPRRLDLVLEIVDERFAPVLPNSNHGVLEIRRLLHGADPSLRAAMAAAVQLKAPQPVSVAAHECVCFALAPAGVLLLAREAADRESSAQCRLELESIGSWLVGAIEANLASAPSDAGTEQYRIASLQRLLTEAAARGSVRDVVRAFAESVAVWIDVEVRGYVLGANGSYLQDVTLVGADPAATPSELDAGVVPAEAPMTRLSDLEIEQLGFISVSEHVLLATVAIDQGVSWLLVFASTIDAQDEASVILYLNLLRESLTSLTAAAAERLVSGLTRHLLRLDDPIEVTAQVALDETIAALGAGQGALAVTASTGTSLLVAGHPELLPGLDGQSPEHLVVTRQARNDRASMTIGVTRETGRFTAHEKALLGTAASLLWSRIQSSLGQLGRGERRGACLPVKEQIERLAAETVRAGGHASVILMSIDETAVRPGLLNAWVARIRNRLRAWDVAGVVTATEIAVLLRETPAEQAALVSERLKKVLELDDNVDFAARPGIGTATSCADRPLVTSLVDAARHSVPRNAEAYQVTDKRLD